MMRFLVTTFLWCISLVAFCQEPAVGQENGRKGEIFFYWGWNIGWHSDSNIRFAGDGYDFTLHGVEASDRQTKFNVDTYLNPANATIPQYNFRIGYFVKDYLSLSFGIDHMKYVVNQNQSAHITGVISGSETVYDGIYDNAPITIQEGFLYFEHTDGLNYANIELRYLKEFLRYKNIKFSCVAGGGGGILYPRTNTTLLGMERYDQFHLSGYGLGGVLGLNINFFKSLFVQAELKGGFANMPDIRTTKNETDRASQHFYFGQAAIVFGASFDL